MNGRMKTGAGTQTIVLTAIIAVLVTVVPNSEVVGGEESLGDIDWKAEIEQIFGSSIQAEEGRLFFFLEEDCPLAIEKYGSCFGNNPASPYGMYDRGDSVGPADSFRWRLAEHQAILFIGMSPPNGRYFSFQTYPFSRNEDNLCRSHSTEEVWFCDEMAVDATCLARRKTLVGLIGPNLNHLELVTDSGDEDSFERAMVLVTTANRAVAARILERLPNRLAELGISPEPAPGQTTSSSSKVVVPDVGECQPVDRCFGDFVADEIVDLEDYRDFAMCMGGVNVMSPEGCDPADSDDDGDGNLRDFAAFQISFSNCR